MSMKKIGQIEDLKSNLSDLEVINDHITESHLMQGSMVIVKNKVESILLYFLLKSHGGWHLSLPFVAHKISITNADSIESN